ncbi:MAG: ABC transporter substrate-binding protein [Donghicola eburneus]|jgi:putative ABC transport system substrate-binding protein|nr:ABC transporter substrate-binding protein [Donghicola eburneus]MCI5042114.1 ABC transporter substrate-binding protein [Donghicola eburneus]
MRKLVTALLMTLAAPAAAEFTTDNPARIDMVVWRGCEEACEGFRRFFSDRNLPVEVNVIDVAKDKSILRDIRDQLNASPPDLAVTWGTSVTTGILGKREEFGTGSALGQTPALFMIVADPVRSDVVESYEKSGRDMITGVRNRVPEETQIALLKSYFAPKRIGVINDPTESNSALNTEVLTNLGPNEGFEVIALEYSLNEENKADPAEIPTLMAELRAQGADAVYVGSSSFNLENRDAFTAAAIDQGLPVFTAYAQMVQDSDALMAVANAYANVGKLAAAQARKILLDGANPAEMPIASLDRFSVFINADTAAALDLYPPIQLINIAEVVKED